ncbi:bifunctional glutathionylspermidine amidase/synthase [Rhodospirillum rubrum]|uniref:Glutathionylspermidine amidase n=1 Tax=Rhodospirillum rubrum (strain ATCC 11170 / ATH 1.1.1 / DSM 467 / LMG 4362 / NCIMB 8255 / S1) TaxID=269796 RepID=Q2RMX8_RHORT|nr:bifunctional glutathionylspermidine amidase/synthase [Rhodospirillum rubrum]ABC24517.1 Glutathionylspermidine amidase [Rhodospirillum rubrum ATCC 11170]AEO50269.1 bifunctional glutathionylspermidine amidase/glutathionylspermidine synthetase [Rhodospirillum rubrum F11]MBK5956242.1 bifunctional glutathionylspermidine amidase/glutathionylspermidine synthase [Rhodospirillum rubrum]QXG80434.1 bifunctional glutathionylspermidine amidase/synthase [Rhodospirillum rubrum]HAP99427.1 bifunctional glut
MSHHHTAESAPFGTVLGYGPGGVAVYSSDYDTVDRRALPDRASFRSVIDGQYMGHKWQCVELARRFLYLTHGYVFDDIAMAYDIFRLRTVRVVAEDRHLPLRSFRNGARRWPEAGSLLIWDEGGEFEVTGHVAVVTEVFADRLRCIEQNVDDRVWPTGQSYSRELPARVDDQGGYHVACTFADTAILGWVMQTADPLFSEETTEADRQLFVPQRRTVAAKPGGAPALWLDPAKPDEAAYMAMMGGCALTNRPADRETYFRISQTAERELKRATNELHAMFLYATDHVLQNDALLAQFMLPQALWPRIRQSWANRRGRMITGRFDFSMSERGLKVYEYNADSASCHMECGKVQQAWAAYYGCQEGRCSGEDVHGALVAAWRESGVDSVLHIMLDHDQEELYHALYMKTAIEEAGIACKIITGVDGLLWDDEGFVTDADGVRITWVWKTWAWETAIDELRAQCAADDEEIRLHRPVDHSRHPPRLIDVLLRKEVMVFEPLWTLIPSNKAILPVLWMMFPNHPYLLDSQFSVTNALRESGYVAKPIVGRCGSNISIFDKTSDLIGETAGQFGNRTMIYQELCPLPRIGGDNVQIGTFSVRGRYAGSSVRVDPAAIITTHSDLLALRIVEDALLAEDADPRAPSSP